ncbi:MAG: polyphosphate kinase 1 [Verrucomicrobiota bacterium]|jgi:polyphosphate kinase|nr:polyphosphate kinase 1 [Verrucomicrobiota bacterium]
MEKEHRAGAGKKMLFLNRELSWIEFNFRVLAQAEDVSLPPLERLRFATITASNADEFFMVRVGGLKSLQHQGAEQPDPAGLTPSEQLQVISSRMHHLMDRQYACVLKQLEPQLRKGGIRRLGMAELNPAQRRHVEAQFEDFIYPTVTPMAVEEGRELPRLPGLGLSLYVRLAGGSAGMPVRHAFVAVPQSLARFLTVPEESGFSYVLLEDVLGVYIDRLFPGVAVLESTAFRITRNADMSVREDLAGDLLAQMREVLTERAESDCVRLEIEKRASREALAFLQETFEVEPQDIYAAAGPLALSSFFRLANLAGYDALKIKPWTPQPVPEAPVAESMFEVLKRGNLLLFHPYESYDPVVRLLQEAAEDPNVLAIKQVLYRVSDNSPIVNALMRAAKGGKHITALIELKARFDEARNMDWADALARAGAQVIYGVKGFKTHAKVCAVVRREPAGVVRYLHYGTGNYNEKSARIYSDISFMTREEDYGADASAFFNTITGYSQLTGFHKIVMAPQGIRSRLLELIEAEIEHSRQGEAAGLDAKMNSLTDPELIHALYRASKAGVKIRLNVRGICCLRPGLKGLSDNIRVVSIVDRYLEHARIFRFYNGGHSRTYLASADWMPRNLDRRIELMVPVEDSEGAEKLARILMLCFADNQQSWQLKADGTYERRHADSRHPPLRCQKEFHEWAEERAVAAAHQTPVFEPQRPADASASGA